MMANKHEIERLAYELWERDGKPAGNELAHYYQAERALSGGPKATRTPARKTAPAPKASASKPRTTRKAA